MKALIVSELRQRIRGKRWWILLGIWFLILLGLTALIRWAVLEAVEDSPAPGIEVGAIMFGSLALLVLALVCLVVPALTATSINGERDRGTLAVLQATLYRPAQIAAAKLAAALITAAAFLLVTVPISLWAFLEGGVPVVRGAAVYLTLFVVSGVLITGALAASAIVKRPALSAVLAYGIVFFLTIGTLILFGIAYSTAPRDPRGFTPDIGARWLVLAPNPFVVLADAAPRSNADEIDDPLSAIREQVRYLRDPEPLFTAPTTPEPPETDPAPLWPAGLGIELVVAVGAAYVTVARLRVPVTRLAPGERVA